MDITVIFAGLSYARELAGYLGLIETLNVKIDKLAGSELDAGLRALEQAKTSEKEMVSLLREARLRLNKAVSLEKNERLIAAYIGLAFCHYNLGDRDNCYATLRCLENLQFDEPIKRAAIGVAEDLLGGSPVISPIARWLTGTKSMTQTYFEARQKRIDELKSSVRAYLNTVS
jgi:hypothetical protein